MPKSTFLNLPAEKRDTLLSIAIAEFAENDYTAASISKIVERAGIAKGSIYQYFADKQEMFIYLVEYAAQTLLAELNQVAPPAADEDFFTTLRRLMSASVRVNAAHPQLSLLLRRSAQAPAPLRDELAKRTGAAAQNYYWQLVQRGIERGELKTAIDPLLATFLISSMLGELGHYISAVLGIDPQQAATADITRFASPQVEAIFDQVIDALRTGLGRQ